MFEDLGLRIKLFSLQALHLLLIMIIGVTGLVGMARIKGDFKTAHQDRTLALVYLSGALDDIHQIKALIDRAAAGGSGGLQPLRPEIARLETDRARLWVEYMGTNIPLDEQPIAFRSAKAWTAYRADLAAQRPREAAADLEGARTTLRELIDVQERAASQGYLAADAMFIKLGLFDLVLICFGCGIACLLFFWDYVRLRRSAPVDGQGRGPAPALVTAPEAQPAIR